MKEARLTLVPKNLLNAVTRAVQFQTTKLDILCVLVRTEFAKHLPDYAQAHRAGRAWMTDVEGLDTWVEGMGMFCPTIVYHRERAFREFDKACQDYENIVSWLRKIDPEAFHQLSTKQQGRHC